jgi:hypothetical protein
MGTGSGIERGDHIPQLVFGHGQREDSKAATSAGAPRSVAVGAEGRAGASSSSPSEPLPTGEQGGGRRRDAGQSSCGGRDARESCCGGRDAGESKQGGGGGHDAGELCSV